MKIIYIIDVNPQNGGAAISTTLLASEMANKLHSVSIIMPSNDINLFKNDGVNYIQLERYKNKFPSIMSRPIETIIFGIRLGTLLKHARPEIVHVQMPRSAWAIGILSFFYKKKYRLIYTDREHMESYGIFTKLLMHLLVNRVFDQIICLTESSYKYWLRFRSESTTHIIPNFAGNHYEKYDEKFHQYVRSKLNIDIKEFTIMFSGRMMIYKNWKLVSEIVDNLVGENITFIFVISTMDEQQKKEYLLFKNKIENKGVKCIFYNNITQEEISYIYYAADLFILTSIKESFGRTAIEAMSRKCAVLGSNVGGLPNVIGKGENVLDLDVQKYCSRILFYKNNRDILESDKMWFYERFLNLYKIENNINKHLEIYKNA